MIAGVGAAVPAGLLTNADLERTLDTTDAWIVERTGIRERHIAGPTETLTSYTLVAARQAMERAKVTAADLDGIIFATVSPDHRLPSAASDLQAALGAERAWAFDRGTAILFGDGAGAAVVKRATGDGRAILSTYMGADGNLASLLHIPGGGSAEPLTEELVRDKRHLIKMAGREVFKAAVLAMSRSTDAALDRAGMTPYDIDIMIPHQANLRIIEATAKHAGISMDKVMVNVDRYGNTSSASIPLAIAQAEAEGRLKPGMVTMLVSFGAGFAWASVVVRW